MSVLSLDKIDKERQIGFIAFQEPGEIDPMPSHKIAKEIEAIVEEFTSNYSIGRCSKGHLKVTLRRDDQKASVVFPEKPKDIRSVKNFRAQIRRTYQQLADAATA
jgi:tRNA/tmRNA/rRNA uracil-C5-methylase (TrmA/RlmC/RlmD family)